MIQIPLARDTKILSFGAVPGETPLEAYDVEGGNSFVQTSGTHGATVQLQGELASASVDIIFSGGTVSGTAHTVHPQDLSDVLSKIIQFGGMSQGTQLVISSGTGASTALDLIMFSPVFSGGVNLLGVVGTTSTAEKFFDRSPFFFGPHESDPNTLRDLREAQQLFVYSEATVTAYDYFNSTTSETQMVSGPGSGTFPIPLHPESQAPTDVVSNGSFEDGFSSWTVAYEDEGNDVVEIRTNQPPAFPGDITPEDGDYWLYTSKRTTTSSVAVRQTIKFNLPSSSDDLRNFSFQALIDQAIAERHNVVALKFLKNAQQTHLHQYWFNGQSFPADMPTELADPTTSVRLNAELGKLNSFTRDIRVDTYSTSFLFDEVQLWIVSDRGGGDSQYTDTLWDDFQLTIDIPPPSLLNTTSAAHVLYLPVPTSSGLQPAGTTVSGSDDVTQTDEAPPFFDELVPASGTTYNDPGTTVTFHVKDAGTTVDSPTIDVEIDGVVVVAAGTAETNAPWTIGTKTVLAPNDYQYVFTRGEPFEQTSVVTVSGAFDDFPAGNPGADSYQFTIVGSGSLTAVVMGDLDADPPTITPTEPVDLDTQISASTAVLWTTSDNASGVDPSTVKLYLNGALMLDGGLAVEGSFTRAANATRGYDYTYLPATNFTFGETVTGTISAADNDGNSDSLVYEFTITPADTLEITNFFLAADESVTLTTGTEVSVDVEDSAYGVEPTSTTLTVNGYAPPGLTTVLSGPGPDKLTFSFLADPLVDFRDDLDVVVHAENKFPGPYPVVVEQTFVLRPGYDVNWYNELVGGSPTAFPYLTNIPVLTEVKNFARYYGLASEFFRFLTKNQPSVDLGATLISNIKIADLSAVVVAESPYFEYGKTIVLEVEVTDLEGNELRFTHTFTIESRS